MHEALKLALGPKAIQQSLENSAKEEQTVFSRQVTVKGTVNCYLWSPQNQRPHRRVNGEIYARADRLCNPNPGEIQTSHTRGGFCASAVVG